MELSVQPFKFAKRTVEFSNDFISLVYKVGGLVIVVNLVLLVFKQDSIAFDLTNKPVSTDPYDQVFDHIRGFREKVDKIDYQDLVKEGKAWNKTLDKLKDLGKVIIGPVIGIFKISKKLFRKSKKDDILDGDEKLVISVLKEAMRRINNSDIDEDDFTFLDEYRDNK